MGTVFKKCVTKAKPEGAEVFTHKGEGSDMKRRFFSDVGRQRFETAWSFLPKTTRKDLRGFIRHVDEFPDIEGIFLYHRTESGSVEILVGPLEEQAGGMCVYVPLPTRVICDVLFVSDLQTAFPSITTLEGEMKEAVHVAVILHELAHANDHFLHGMFRDRSEYDKEQFAWNLVLEWASSKIPNTALSDTIKAFAYASYFDNAHEQIIDRIRKLARTKDR